MHINTYLPATLAILTFSISSISFAAQDHARDHGGQLHFATELQQQWSINKAQQDSYALDLTSRLGTDEQAMKLELEYERAASEANHLKSKLVYSHMLSDFWNLELGARYIQERLDQAHATHHEQRWQAVFGIEGLAPYFIETEAYLALGKDNFQAFNVHAEREFLLTQRWHMSPFAALEYVINDDARNAKAKGFNTWALGLDLRYELSKQIVPFLRMQYREQKPSNSALARHAEHHTGAIYGAGLSLHF